MTTESFMKDWNDTFPNCTIHPNDLAHPTKAFLIKSLVIMLRSVHIDLDAAEFDSPDADTARAAKLYLIHYVSRLYKDLANKKFSYIDLIQPSEFLQLFLTRS